MQHVSWLEAGTRRRYLGVIDASCSEVCIKQTNVSRIFYSQFVHLSKVLRWLEAGRLTAAGFCWDTAEEEAAGGLALAGRGERVLEATLRNCGVRPHPAPAPAPASSLARVLHTELQLQLAPCDHGAAETASHSPTSRGHFLRLAQMII